MIIRKRTATTTTALALLLVAALSTPAMGHHSYAMYDTAVEKTLTGKLVRFIIGANHSQYVLRVLNADGTEAVTEKGEPLTWQVETQAAAQLARIGITDKSFPIGTVFTVTFSPLLREIHEAAEHSPEVEGQERQDHDRVGSHAIPASLLSLAVLRSQTHRSG